MDGESDKVARRRLGITGKKFLDRLKAALQRDCTLADAPRPGRPIVYTLSTLDAALDWFDSNYWLLLTKEELVSELQEAGILSNNAKVDGFYPAFKAHLSEYGLRLKWGQRGLTFALTTQHQVWRKEWCLHHQVVSTFEDVDSFWFCDEIVIEEGGHPKGECAIEGHAVLDELKRPAAPASSVDWLKE